MLMMSGQSCMAFVSAHGKRAPWAQKISCKCCSTCHRLVAWQGRGWRRPPRVEYQNHDFELQRGWLPMRVCA